MKYIVMVRSGNADCVDIAKIKRSKSDALSYAKQVLEANPHYHNLRVEIFEARMVESMKLPMDKRKNPRWGVA